MSTVEITVRLDSRQNDLFRALTRQLGLTPAEALRMFVCDFNAAGGFPYGVRAASQTPAEPFETEQEALNFSSRMTSRLLREHESDEEKSNETSPNRNFG